MNTYQFDIFMHHKRSAFADYYFVSFGRLARPGIAVIAEGGFFKATLRYLQANYEHEVNRSHWKI